MSITIDDIKVNYFLIGFHAFRKDHNYISFKGNYINDISEYFDYLLIDQLDAGPLTLLKSPSKSPIFEIKISANQLIYQDDIEFSKIVNNAKHLLNLWRNFSNLVSLKLAGIVHYFQINVDNMEKVPFENMLKHFNGFNTFVDISKIGLNVNHQLLKNGQTYRINLSLNQNDKNGPIEGFVDFHRKMNDSENGISDDNINRVFTDADDYFKNGFINFLM